MIPGLAAKHENVRLQLRGQSRHASRRDALKPALGECGAPRRGTLGIWIAETIRVREGRGETDPGPIAIGHFRRLLVQQEETRPKESIRLSSRRKRHRLLERSNPEFYPGPALLPQSGRSPSCVGHA